MTNYKKTTRRSCNYNAPELSTYAKEDMPIIASNDFKRGARWAGWALIGMFVFLSLGCVMFAW